MPDRRRHRGAHPADAALFADDRLAVLRQATADLSWLLGRGYADAAALTLVGDHFQLPRRARIAVRRCAATDAQVTGRTAKRVDVAGRDVIVDGFNVLVNVESALGGGVLLRGRDGVVRDMASVHGTYRSVDETRHAARLLLAALAPAASVRWLLDRPVGNSGRTAAMLREEGAANVELLDAVDAELKASGRAVATGDGPVIDAAAAHVDLVGVVLAGLEVRIVDLGGQNDDAPTEAGAH